MNFFDFLSGNWPNGRDATVDHAVRVLKGLGHRGIRWACPGGACLSHLYRTRLPRRRVGRRGLIRHNTIPSYVSFGLLVTLLGLGVGVLSSRHIPQSAISSSCADPGNYLQRAHECALAQFPFEGCGRGSAPASAAREALTGTSKPDRLPVDGVLTGAGTEIGRGAPLGDCAGKDFPSEDESGSPGRVLPARMLWSRMGDRLNIRFRRSAESTWGVSWPSAPFCIPAAIDRFAEQMGTDHDV